MRASPAILASAYSFANEGPSGAGPSPSLLRGRWTCTITAAGERGGPGTVATGLLDVLHAGSYLVGSGWLDGSAAKRAGAGPELPAAGLEGPMFGAVRGEEVILWVTNVFRTAMWVLRGKLAPRGRVISGSAVYTDTSRGTQWSYQARFVLSDT